MSYDLTIRADRDYSRSTEVGRLMAFIARLPHLRPNGARRFVLDDPPSRWMNIDLEFIGPDREYDEELTERGPETNCVRLHIPYAFLGDRPERDYFPTAWAIAKFLGWRLYDQQSGEDVPDGAIPKGDAAVFYEEILRALGLDEAVPAPPPLKKPSKSKTKPVKSKTKPVKSKAKPVKSKAKPVKSKAKPSKSKAKPARSKTKPARSTRRKSSER